MSFRGTRASFRPPGREYSTVVQMRRRLSRKKLRHLQHQRRAFGKLSPPPRSDTTYEGNAEGLGQVLVPEWMVSFDDTSRLPPSIQVLILPCLAEGLPSARSSLWPTLLLMASRQEAHPRHCRHQEPAVNNERLARQPCAAPLVSRPIRCIGLAPGKAPLNNAGRLEGYAERERESFSGLSACPFWKTVLSVLALARASSSDGESFSGLTACLAPGKGNLVLGFDTRS